MYNDLQQFKLTSSPIKKTLSSRAISSSSAELSASRTVICMFMSAMKFLCTSRYMRFACPPMYACSSDMASAKLASLQRVLQHAACWQHKNAYLVRGRHVPALKQCLLLCWYLHGHCAVNVLHWSLQCWSLVPD